MNNNEEIIDFRELNVSVPGEDLQNLARHLGKRMRLNPISSGRGPDGQKDLLFTEIIKGPLSDVKITWLVSCKDLATSGKSVQEGDLPKPGITDKLKQHKAEGFLLVTTTTVSAGAKALLDSLDKKSGGDIYTSVWDSAELKAMLLDPSNSDILRQYLPKSFKKVYGLTSIKSVLETLKPQMPEEIYIKLVKMIEPYLEEGLNGASIWPFDLNTADKINQIVKWLIIENDISKAFDLTINMEQDAFYELIERLQEKYPEMCQDYLFILATKHPDSAFRYNTTRILFDNFEVNPVDALDIYKNLDSSEISELLGSEVTNFVSTELMVNTPNYYELHNEIDQLSSNSSVDEVIVESLEFKSVDEGAIHFSGECSITVDFEFEHEDMGSMSFPGKFEGYFNINGIFIESVSVDTSEFYE